MQTSVSSCYCVVLLLSVLLCLSALQRVSGAKERKRPQMAQPLYITEEEVERYLDWNKLFQRTEDAMKAASQGAAIQPPRLVMQIPEKNGTIFSMPGYVSGILSCKVITAFTNNAAKGLDSIFANVLVFDSNTGQLKAIVAGNELTGRRTAAATAVASRALKKEWPKPRILAIFGAGRQAHSHTHALTKIYNTTDVEVRIWNRRAARANEMASRLKAEGFNVTAMADTEEGARACAHGADIIVTATPSKTPVLKGAWVKPGAVVHAVGHYDVDDELYRKSTIYTDTKAAAKTELAHVEKLGVPITGEIGEILAGTLTPTKPSSSRPFTLFHSLGMAVEDSVASQIVYDEYLKNKKVPTVA